MSTKADFGLARARHLHGLLRYSFPSRFPFPVFLDTLSNAERGDLADQSRGNGFSSGNWIDPLAVANFERSFAKALTAVQEASLAAAMQWPSEGLPDNPRGWLTQVAFRRMADHIRSESARRRRESEVAQVAQVAAHTTESTVIETAPQED